MPSKSKLSALDQLRGLAILGVFLYHSLGACFGYGSFRKWEGLFRSHHIDASVIPLLPISFGFLGVPLFFVLSGFCIHLSHARSGETGFNEFFVRRFFRIYPPYFLTLAIMVVAVPVMMRANHFSTGDILSHFLLAQNARADWYPSINGSLWSICIEAQLYVLYPMLVIASRRVGWDGVLLGTVAIELFIRIFASVDVWRGAEMFALLIRLPIAYWFTWALGAWLADRYVRGQITTVKSWWVMAAITGIIAGDIFQPLSIFIYPLAAIISWCAIAIIIRRDDGAEPGNAGQWLGKVGTVSYSFYLIHQPIVEYAASILVGRPWCWRLTAFLICALGVCPLTYLVSVVIYRKIELPSIAAGKWLINRFHAQVGSAGSPAKTRR